jgi:hypothetical protein
MAKNKQQGVKSDVLNMGPQSLGSLLSSLGGGAFTLSPKEFSSGKVGLNGNGTATIKCGKAAYKFSVSINATAIDSAKSPLPEGGREAVLGAGSMTLKDLGLDKVQVTPREFSSGKVGFYHGDKASLKIGDVLVKLQVGCPIVAWHSDGWPAERAAKADKKDEASA